MFVLKIHYIGVKGRESLTPTERLRNNSNTYKIKQKTTCKLSWVGYGPSNVDYYHFPLNAQDREAFMFLCVREC